MLPIFLIRSVTVQRNYTRESSFFSFDAAENVTFKWIQQALLLVFLETVNVCIFQKNLNRLHLEIDMLLDRI